MMLLLSCYGGCCWGVAVVGVGVDVVGRGVVDGVAANGGRGVFVVGVGVAS